MEDFTKYLDKVDEKRTFSIWCFMDTKNNENDIYRVIKLNVEYDNQSLLYILNFLDGMNNNYNVLYNSVGGMCDGINLKLNFQTTP
jgi:hypothetical protein